MKLSDLKPTGTGRSSFNETWLSEMPKRIGKADDLYDGLQASINYFLGNKIVPTKLGKDLWKIETSSSIFYWFSWDNDPKQVDLAVELERMPQGLVVSALGKDPNLAGGAPYASDLYAAVLRDSGKNIRLLSDTHLSDDGERLWKKMVDMGFKVSVYNNENPGQSFQTFTKPAELDAFLSHSKDTKKYQFVLSEDILEWCSLQANFKLREIRELNPKLELEDFLIETNLEEIINATPLSFKWLDKQKCIFVLDGIQYGIWIDDVSAGSIKAAHITFGVVISKVFTNDGDLDTDLTNASKPRTVLSTVAKACLSNSTITTSDIIWIAASDTIEKRNRIYSLALSEIQKDPHFSATTIQYARTLNNSEAILLIKNQILKDSIQIFLNKWKLKID